MKKVIVSKASAAVKNSGVSGSHVAASNGATATVAETVSLSDIPTQLQSIEASCGYGDPLDDETRKQSSRLIDRVPSTIVERVITLAQRGKGSVAGIALDPVAAKQALANADQADAIATAAAMLVRRAQDEAIRLRSGVAGQASAVRITLRGYVRTPQGASLVQENDELRSLAKRAVAARKARKTREGKADVAAAPPTSNAPAEAAAAETPAPTKAS
jgi:hypothetical protein